MHTTLAQRLFSLYSRFGRLRSAVCAPCLRASRTYPVANTCQVPHFGSLPDLYKFVFGYREQGLFVEVGAFDGESFSNTSGLADVGWTGHYLEPIPDYAAACARRHAGNPLVKVHRVAAGRVDGEVLNLTPAGPFTSAVEDELRSVTESKLGGALTLLGWMPANNGAAPDAAVAAPAVRRRAASSSARGRSPAKKTPALATSNAPAPAAGQIVMTTTSLDTFFRREKITPRAVDVMVVDVEGLEWPIFQGFDLAHWAPKLVIVEIQEKQARYRDNARVQSDAREIEAYFAKAGYSIIYRDVINTIFIHPAVRCAGGD